MLHGDEKKKNSPVIKWILYLFFIGVSWHMYAEISPDVLNQYKFKLENWTVERGLPHNAVLTILQSGDGYLWLGTLNGLARFDGERYVIFNAYNTKALKNDTVRALLEDRKGNLWIGTDGGLVKFHAGQFTYYTLPEIKSYSVFSLLEDSKKRLWIGTNGEGIFCKDGENITRYGTAEGLSDPFVRSLFEDQEKRIMASTDGGLNVIEDGKIRVFTREHGLLSNVIGSICQDRDQSLLIATQEGVNRYKDGKFTVFPLPREYAGKAITAFFKDRQDTLWFGVGGSGLLRFKDGKFTAIAAGEEHLKNLIYTIFEDNENSIWIGAADGGLNMLRSFKFVTISGSEGLSHDSVFSLFEDHERTLWVGTYEGLNQWKNGQNRILTVKDGLSHNAITALYEDQHKNLWIGTMGGGLNRFSNNEFTVFTQQKNGLTHDKVWSIHEDNQGDLWIGTSEGLNKFKNGRFTTYTTRDGLSHNFIRFIVPDNKNNLWIGTYGDGLNLYKNGKFRVFNTEHGLSNDMVLFIHIDDENVLWIATVKGLNRFKNNVFTSYSQEDGLFSESVRHILEDDDNRLWLGSSAGIFWVDKKELNDFALGEIDKINSHFYNRKDGMKSTTCFGGCQPPAIKTRDGRLWFSTLKGVTMVNPGQLTFNENPPRIVIETLIVDGEKIDTNRVVKSDPVVLSPGKKRFEFHYTALSFMNPQKARFKYKLEGYDKEWINAESQRNTIYTGLPAGDYCFRVTACNEDGFWNEDGTSLEFHLKPFFYKTTLFYILLISSIILVTYFGFRFRVRQLRARAKELKIQVELRTRDLQIAHDEIKESKQIIEEKNQHILDSIQYASKIQTAILSINDQMEKVLTDHFVIFRPRDIVSGDFFWFTHFEDKYFIAVADCTGHGVPGALLSMIGIMELNDFVNKKHIFDPALILHHLHLDFRRILQQERASTDTLDGMDVALCLMDMKKNKLTFAGAKRPLLMVTEKENQPDIEESIPGPEGEKRHKSISDEKYQLSLIKGDRKPIGGHQKEHSRIFKNFDFKINPNSYIYLLSDGLVDQVNHKEEKFGYRRLQSLLLSHSALTMAEQKKALIEEIKNFQGGEEQRDDITLVGIKLL